VFRSGTLPGRGGSQTTTRRCTAPAVGGILDHMLPVYPSVPPPTPSTEPAAVPVTRLIARRASFLPRWVWPVAGLASVVFVSIAVAISAIAIKGAANDLRAAAKDIDAMMPPTNDKLFSILAQGIGVGEDVVRTTTATNVAPSAAFVTDLTTTPLNQRTDAFTQEIVIRNLHATQSLCFGSVPWTAVGATCTLKCAGSGMTCSGAGTDGIFTGPGQVWQRRYDGTNCICVVASAAATSYQSERVLR